MIGNVQLAMALPSENKKKKVKKECEMWGAIRYWIGRKSIYSHATNLFVLGGKMTSDRAGEIE